MPDVNQIVRNYKTIKGQRMNFDTYYQTLHDIYYVEAENVNQSYYPGTELDFDDLYDTNTLMAADVLGAGIQNYLTPSTSKWFSLRTKDPAISEKKDVAMYLKDVEAEVYHILNKSNFYTQIPEFYKGSGVYGTQVMLEEEDDRDVARFYTLPIKNTYLALDARGRVAEYYLKFEYTALEAVSRFGEDKVSEKIRKSYQENRDMDAKYEFCLYIAERHERDPNRTDKKNMPVKAIWIEMASGSGTGGKIVAEGGYQDFPCFTHRFYTRPGVTMGFSPAMKALPNARYLNVMAETILRSSMKHADPPVALPDNAFVIPLNLNPSAVNYYNKSKMSAGDAFPIGNYGNTGINMEMMNYHTEQLRQLMFTDVFLAFQGLTKQMTVPEVQERITEKMTLLGPAVGRFISDVLDNVISRTINIASRQGKLPRPPDALLKDPSYEIEYVSALARAQKMGDMTNLTNALSTAGNIMQAYPEVRDKINPDAAVDVVWGITGADISVLRDDEEVQKIRKARAEAEAAEQQLAVAGQVAEIAERGASAEGKISQARASGVGV